MLEAYSPLGNPSSPFRQSKDPSVLEDPVIKEVAEKHKVSVGQVCNVNRHSTVAYFYLMITTLANFYLMNSTVANRFI